MNQNYFELYAPSAGTEVTKLLVFAALSTQRAEAL